ncbi:MAG: hypothetical protein H0X49_00125 [Acidobacteria bacterium]|nr:hypothetical protein [Acidobacteriota bacterium]
MKSTELIENSQEEIDGQSITLIIAAFSLAGLALYLFYKKFNEKIIIIRDPPPIIIKTGSFVIETKEILINDENSNIYKIEGFGEIKTVRVISIDEITGEPTSDDFNAYRVEIDVTLQKYINNDWVDTTPLVTIRAVDDANNSKDFVLEIAEKLEEKGVSTNPERKYRWENISNNNDERLRIGKVVVREYKLANGTVIGKNPTPYETKGDYQIWFYSNLE